MKEAEYQPANPKAHEFLGAVRAWAAKRIRGFEGIVTYTMLREYCESTRQTYDPDFAKQVLSEAGREAQFKKAQRAKKLEKAERKEELKKAQTSFSF